MSGQEVSDFAKTIIERWGFPTLVALAAGYVLRQDVLLPLVSQHSAFLETVGATQQSQSESLQEISRAVNEQTKLLYAIQPKAGDEP